MFLEHILATNGFKHYSVSTINGTTAVVSFEDETEYLVFVLKDILKKVKEESGLCMLEPDFDFMIRLEKKLKTYSKFDEYVIRAFLKET